MKNIFKTLMLFLFSATILSSGCKKDKNDPKVEEPAPPTHDEEIITSFRWLLTDSASNTTFVYSFSDPDGPGGNAAFYGPGTSAATSNQSDSVITLATNTTYYGRIILLNETKNPVDTVSHEVIEEGDEHMFFYNHGANQVLNAGVPYSVKLNGSGIEITYTDLDEGSTKRSLGLETRIRTRATAARHPLVIALKHQPGNKDGTYGPGETDIEVEFKVVVE